MVTELASPVTLKSPTADSGPECNIKGEFTNTLWIINTRISVTPRGGIYNFSVCKGSYGLHKHCLIWQAGRLNSGCYSGSNVVTLTLNLQ